MDARHLLPSCGLTPCSGSSLDEALLAVSVIKMAESQVTQLILTTTLGLITLFWVISR